MTNSPASSLRRWLLLALLVLLLGLGLNMAFFGISVRCVPPSADEAIAGLQALDVMRGCFEGDYQCKASLNSSISGVA